MRELVKVKCGSAIWTVQYERGPWHLKIVADDSESAYKLAQEVKSPESGDVVSLVRGDGVLCSPGCGHVESEL